MKNTRYIYCYSTPTYIDKGWVKVGQTDRTPDQRIREQDTTSNPEELELLWFIDVSDDISDTMIHKKLEQLGCPLVRNRREWFECDIEDVKKAINLLVHGAARPNSYSMRPEQQECHDKMVEFYQKNPSNSSFLMNAKPRFGKCFTTLQFVKTMDYENVLILTLKPQVEPAWKEEVENHINFSNFAWCSAADGQINASNDKSLITFCSFQQLTNKKGVKKVEWLFEKEWDMVILDEEHYGTKTEISTEILKKLNYQNHLALSGTPLKSILSGLYSEDQRYDWTLTDEQAKRKAEEDSEWQTEVYRLLPKLKLYGIDLSPEVIEQAKKDGFVGDDAFHINKFFAAQDGKFENEMLVRIWLDSISKKVPKSKGSFAPFYFSDIPSDAFDHLLMFMPMSVDSVKALEGLLKKHPFFVDYHIIRAAGTDGLVDIEECKKQIKKHDKTITLSCGRFNTGVSVPQWKCVFMLDGTKSAETYWQSIMRVQTPWVNRNPHTRHITGYNKEECYVLDFNPQRQLEVVYDYCSQLSKKGENTSNTLKEFLDVTDVISVGKNGFSLINVNDINRAMFHSGAVANRFGSETAVNAYSINEELLSKLSGIPISKLRKMNFNFGLNEDLELGKTQKQQINSLSPKDKKVAKTAIQKAKEKVKMILKRVPTIVFNSHEKSVYSCDDLLLIDDKKFTRAVGVNLDLFKSMIEIGCVNKSFVDRCIEDFQYVIDGAFSLDN
jgi:superfamily II DNA or RNA helicase